MAMTPTEIVITLDLGTTGIKAGAFDERLRCLHHAHLENRLHHPAPGLVEQDPAFFEASALELTRQIVGKLGQAAKRVVAIVCSGQMGGVLGIDADWNAVGHFDAVLDPRSNICRGQIEPHTAHILEHCGGLTAQLEKMLYWRDYYPDAYARLDKFVALNGFLAGRLAGLKASAAFTDLTFSGVNGVMSARSGTWEPELLQALGLPPEKLPRVVPSESVVGVLDARLAAALGLPRGVQVLAGAGDGAATYAGSGMNRPGLALDLSGTSCALGAYSDRFLPDVDDQYFINMKSPTSPGWFVIHINHFGRTHRWFVDTFCPDLVQAGGIDGAYAALDREAGALAPGSGGVLAVPHLSGRPSPPDPATRGAWLGFGLGYTRAHFYRALLEAHAVEYGQAKAHLAHLSGDLELREVFVAGGGSRSDFWNQMKANVLGSRYRRLVGSDLSTLRGDALIAARARGWERVDDDPAFLEFDREYQPDPALAECYAGLTANYRSMVEGLDPVMGRLFT
jgi:xylulokinase